MGIKSDYTSLNKPRLKRGLMEVHFAVVLFGVSGLFGKWLPLHPLIIVLGRVAFAAPFLLLLLLLKREPIKLKRVQDYYIFLLLGAILALHWTTFFYAIQRSTVAIALLTFSTFPVFVTFAAPMLLKTPIRLKDIGIAVVTLIGVALVIPSFSFENQMTIGALLGILSGATFALLSVLNKKYVAQYSSRVISFYQFTFAALILLPMVLPLQPALSVRSIGLLALLGVVFTGVSHTLFINGMKIVRAQTASIIASLEPVYGILASMIFFGAFPDSREYVGGAIILSMAFLASKEKMT